MRLYTPNGIDTFFYFKQEFLSSNNKTEYGTLVVTLMSTLQMGIAGSTCPSSLLIKLIKILNTKILLLDLIKLLFRSCPDLFEVLDYSICHEYTTSMLMH